MKRRRGRRKVSQVGKGVKDDGGSNGDGGDTPGERLDVDTGESEDALEPPLLREVKEIRIEALKILVGVEEGLGREGRAKRWRALVVELESRRSVD